MSGNKTPSVEFYCSYLHDVGGIEQEAAEALAAALAAERDRADRAEARITSAPHSRDCDVWQLGRSNENLGFPCNCWKSEATA